MNFHTQSGNVLLLEFSSQVALDESGLFNSLVSILFRDVNSDDDDIDIDEGVAGMQMGIKGIEQNAGSRDYRIVHSHII